MVHRIAAAVALCPLLFGAADEHIRRLDEAATVFEEIMGTPDKAIPQDMLNKADCVVVVPGLKKGAFIVGAKYGRGFVSCRKQGGMGWSAPAAIRVEGGSLGFQIGGSETDVIMLVMNQRGVKRLLSNKFTLGGDASVAAGPVGRSAAADTDATLRAEILTWSRSRGVFAGVALNGATLRPDKDANHELYGRNVDNNRDIVLTDRAAPESASRLLSLLNKYSSRKTQ